jgi:signal transduction histidine kinase
MGVVVDSERQRAYHRTILHEAERLSRLIDNVLDFNRLQTGRKKFSFEMGDPATLTEEVESIMGEWARQEGFDFGSRCAPGVPRCLYDHDALLQALVNLVANAMKYSDEERWVRLEAFVDDGQLVFSVRDRGKGIPAADQQLIFDRFYRGGNPLTREQRGAGLGLAIVKLIADAHDGRVELDSTPKKGSDFRILLPIREGPPATSERPMVPIHPEDMP